MHRCALTLIVAALVAAVAASARADVFLMKGGGRLTGDAALESKDDHGTKWVHVRTGFGTVRLQKKLIKKTLKAKKDKNVIRLTEIAVVALEGDVRVSRDKGETWVPLRLFPPEGATVAGDQIPPRLGPGDRVKTAEDGRGEFDVGYGVVHLEASGEVVFNAAGASLAVLKGRTGVRVDDSAPKRKFTVETPQASMGVRGTMFLVDVDGDATRVTVGEGEVAVGRTRVRAGAAVRVVAEASPERGDPDADADARFERLRRSFAFPRLEWIAIPGGEFVMGSATIRPPPRGWGATTPVQQLDMPGFLMTRTELTIADFRSVRKWARRVGLENVVRTAVPPGQLPMKDVEKRADPPMTDDEPARVPWYDARAVAAAYGARLQSEAEWEYAHYAGATTRFYWGDTPNEEMLEYEWLAANSGDRQMTYQESQQLRLPVLRALRCHPHSVGTRRPNAWGLHDILSNAPEWCEDTALPDLDGQPKDGSPRVQGNASRRSVRGADLLTANPLHPRQRRLDATSKPYGVRLVRRIAQE